MKALKRILNHVGFIIYFCEVKKKKDNNILQTMMPFNWKKTHMLCMVNGDYFKIVKFLVDFIFFIMVGLKTD